MRNLVGGLLAVIAVSATAARAQERVEEADLPPDVAEQIVAFFNDPSTLRFNGRSRVPEGRRIVGDVGVLGGPLLIAGVIEGDVILVNGDLTIEEGGHVTGDLTVIGGQVNTLPDGSLAGQLTVYDQRLPYITRGGEVRLRGGPRTDRRGLYLGNSRITIRAGTNYNRVEGLPVLFGPVFRTSGENPLRLEALGIWRTESGVTRDDLGYQIRLEQQLGVPALFTIGASAFSEVTPIEAWGLRDLEASLVSFLLHRDYRDYYERQGFSLFAGLRHPSAPLDLQVEYRHEEHLNLPVASPWSLRRNDAPWRPMPLIAAGDLESLSLAVTLDRRNDPADPTDGWYLHGRLTRGIGGELTRPGFTDPADDSATPAAPVPTGLTSAFVDVRRYARVGPDSDLTFRGVLGGSVDGDPLPVQFQHAMGGEGSLPGFRLLSQDCGARAQVFRVERGTDDDPGPEPVFASYGCDRIALFQLEYRNHFSIDIGFGPDDEEEWEDWDWYPRVDLSPSWTVFFDAGRGWSLSPEGRDDETVADLGAGLLVGDLGLYWAFPLTGDDKRVNFFVRLQRRF
jgi:hypothetical protein